MEASQPLTIGQALAGGGAMAALQGGMSIIDAQKKNAAIESAMKSQNRALSVQQQQIASAAGLDQKKQLSEAAKLRGALRVAAASRGVAGGSVAGSQRQAGMDTEMNSLAIRTNMANQIRAARSAAVAQNTGLAAQGQSPLMAGVQGALSGFSTGLNIMGGLNQFRQ